MIRAPDGSPTRPIGGARRLAPVSSSPSGTVTFLLADVEGSSALQSDERVDYPVVIGRIRSILRQGRGQTKQHKQPDSEPMPSRMGDRRAVGVLESCVHG